MIRKIILTETDIQNIITLHNQGKLNREIADQYNISASSISRILRENNIESKHPRLTMDRKISICNCYKLY